MALAARRSEPTTTAHPHIVQTPGVCGGRPRIRNTRIPVSAVAALVRRGEETDEIAASFGRVDPGAVADAILYYLDHREQIDAEIEANTLESALGQADAALGEDGVIRFRDRSE